MKEIAGNAFHPEIIAALSLFALANVVRRDGLNWLPKSISTPESMVLIPLLAQQAYTQSASSQGEEAFSQEAPATAGDDQDRALVPKPTVFHWTTAVTLRLYRGGGAPHQQKAPLRRCRLPASSRST